MVTLRRFQKASSYNRWIADTIRPFVGRRVLEIGAGIGNLSRMFLGCERLALTNIEPFYVEQLKKGSGDQAHV